MGRISYPWVRKIKPNRHNPQQTEFWAFLTRFHVEPDPFRFFAFGLGGLGRFFGFCPPLRKTASCVSSFTLPLLGFFSSNFLVKFVYLFLLATSSN
jgi:hypothetical protein